MSFNRSGKSSLITAIFRIEELRAGSILLDGININTMALDDLRRRICLIPQDPFMFRGSLRFNIDPMNEYTDDEIRIALQDVGLLQFIDELPGGLETIVSEGGDNFSAGQRQVRLC